MKNVNDIKRPLISIKMLPIGDLGNLSRIRGSQTELRCFPSAIYGLRVLTSSSLI